MMTRFAIAFFALTTLFFLGSGVVFAQSSQDDLCTIRLEQEGFPVGGCVESSACNNINGGDFAAFIPPNESPLCAPSEVCCYSESGGGLGGFTPAPAEPTPAPEAPAGPQPGQPVTLPDPLGGVTVPAFFGNVIRVFLSVAGAIALLMFVYGGIMWILSSGKPEQVKSAQKVLVNATIGLILLFGAYLFTSAILSALLGASSVPTS